MTAAPPLNAGEKTSKDSSPSPPTGLDWTALRERSLAPGGFGADRATIWPQLLGVTKSTTIAVKQEEDETEVPTPHRDERQIRLDTDRSFVLYPVDASNDRKDDMQEILHKLIVSVFRKRPKLHYFQGYHDIMTVLFLTLPPEMQLVCAEKISLHRVRDSMGSTLEPVLGLLRVIRNLLRLADRTYADSLELTSPLPFYALSNILTLFSHDMPTLPLIQHVFDYLLCRPPIAVVYLATAIILDRKNAIERLSQEDEDEGMGMAHSLLSSLPSLLDADISLENPGAIQDQEEERSDEPSIMIKKEEETTSLMQQDSPLEEWSNISGVTGTETKGETPVANHADHEAPLIPKIEDAPVTLEGSHPSASSIPEPPKADPSAPPSRSPSPRAPPAADPVTSTTLTFLLTRAETLWSLYPPTHPELHLSSIMGPQSVVFTWNEDFKALPSDREAEAMVGYPGLIVYPYIEEEDSIEEDNVDGWEEKDGGRGKKGRGAKGKGKSRGKEKRHARKLRKTRMVERRTMVAGAVLILGVAMAVYGVKVHSGGERGSRSGVFGLSFGLVEPGKEWKGLKKVGGWLGGLMAGTAERMLNVAGHNAGKLE